MLHLRERVKGPDPFPSGPTLTLPFEDRRRSRLLTQLDDGRPAALQLARGLVLVDGDQLRADEAGLLVTVRAASELLSVAHADDPHLLARAAYHLGNRHVPLQIGPGWVAYQHDHVLDHLARDLGMHVESLQRPFEPEAGGYQQGHRHSPSHAHSHDHGS